MYLSSHLRFCEALLLPISIHSVGSCNLDFFVCFAEVAVEFRSETRLNLASMKAKPNPRQEDKRLTYHRVHTPHIFFCCCCATMREKPCFMSSTDIYMGNIVFLSSAEISFKLVIVLSSLSE